MFQDISPTTHPLRFERGSRGGERIRMPNSDSFVSSMAKYLLRGLSDKRCTKNIENYVLETSLFPEPYGNRGMAPLKSDGQVCSSIISGL